MTVDELYVEGKRYFEAKEFHRAEQCFLKLVRMGSRYADVLNMLGVIYHSDEKFNNAIECFQEALKINPRYTEATLNLTVLFNDLGEYDKARDLYENLQKKGKGMLVITHYARLLHYLKPDYVHVMVDGKIVKSGGPALAQEVEEKGYKDF